MTFNHNFTYKSQLWAYNLNSKQPFPRVPRYQRRSDIKEVDTTKVRVYLYMCGTHHTCDHYLYIMTFWRSGSVVLTMPKMTDVDFD